MFVLKIVLKTLVIDNFTDSGFFLSICSEKIMSNILINLWMMRKQSNDDDDNDEESLSK